MKSLNEFLNEAKNTNSDYVGVRDKFFAKDKKGNMSFSWKRGNDDFEITGDFKKWDKDEFQEYPITKNGKVVGDFYYDNEDYAFFISAKSAFKSQKIASSMDEVILTINKLF